MPPDRPSAGSPDDWLRHARSDLALARQRGEPDILLEALCFHTQQAAEKCIKAVLLHHGTKFPFTHSIARLITTLDQAGIPLSDDLREAADLTDYAVELRYPGPTEPVTEDEYQRATGLAERVLAWAEATVQGQPPE